MKIIPLSVLIAVAAFIFAMGVFVYVTETAAYAGHHPETCANCHVMDAVYENYYHAAHEKWAVCADCHLPHENVFSYYSEKGRQGAHDVYVFSLNTTPVLIRANEHSQEIIQTNCVRCHEDTVETIMAGAQPFDRNCWDCHRTVAHGERGVATVPYQDSNFYPVK